jgi:hypothetical protein
MSATTDTVRNLQRQRQELLAKMSSIGEFRQGTLLQRFIKCGKASCRCAKSDAHAHGPYSSLTYAVASKTVTRLVPAGDAVDRTRQQITEFKRFQEWVVQFTDVNRALCDTQLTQAKEQAKAALPAGAAKKGASKRISSRRSSGKSRS